MSSGNHSKPDENIIDDGQLFLQPSLVLGKEQFSVVNMAPPFYKVVKMGLNAQIP
jgi:hypothetical protein